VVPEFLQADATRQPRPCRLDLYDDTVTRRRLEALFAGMARSTADTATMVGEAVASELRAAGIAC
jgi:hypothetical protein